MSAYQELSLLVWNHHHPSWLQMATTVMVPGTPRGAACVSKHCQGLESGSAAPVFVLSGNTQLTKKLQCPAPVFSVCLSFSEECLVMLPGEQGEGGALPVLERVPKQDYGKLQEYEK